MTDLATLVEEVVVAAITSERGFLPRKSMTGWAIMALSVLLGCTGIFLSILGLERFLEGRYAPDISALLSAAVVFAVAFIAAMTGHYLGRRKASALAAGRNEIGKNIRAVIGDICDELDEPVRENPKTAVLLAAFAGFLTAQQRMGA